MVDVDPRGTGRARGEEGLESDAALKFLSRLVLLLARYIVTGLATRATLGSLPKADWDVRAHVGQQLRAFLVTPSLLRSHVASS